MTCFSHAQEKNEVEVKTTFDEFPEEAKSVLNTLPNTLKRLRFFKETDGDKISYEAKFKYNKRFYSAEFGEDGLLEDVEVLIKKRDLEIPVFNAIDTYLKTHYKRYRILKLQKQFVSIHAAFEEIASSENKYELIIEIKNSGQRTLAEFTFNASGKFESKRLVVPSSYDYVLY